jgi:hypothetical protein
MVILLARKNVKNFLLTNISYKFSKQVFFLNRKIGLLSKKLTGTEKFQKTKQNKTKNSYLTREKRIGSQTLKSIGRE